ncbi:hypothetical protein [Streptacidiphilus neutrinimicus]|uniref:hypothetical protein n=1 Tax=Streptacidiphilus neutrinimicus TaxID=105420 RepID=UPI0005A5EFF8|nr:hypothetical protein [Streptacidiphilus neutrinimicus]
MFRFARALALLCSVSALALAAGCSGSSGPTPAEASASAQAAQREAANAVRAAQLTAETRRLGEYHLVGRQLDQALAKDGISASGRLDAAFPASSTGCLVGYRLFLQGDTRTTFARALRDDLAADGWKPAPPVSDGFELTWHNWQAWIDSTRLPDPAWTDVPFSGPGQVLELRAQSEDPDCQ